MSPDRRQFLGSLGLLGAVAVAGCSQGNGDEDGSREIQPWQRVGGYVLSKSRPMELYEPRTDNKLTDVHWHSDGSHWHSTPLEVPLGSWESYELRVNNDDLEPIPVSEDDQLGLEIIQTEDTPEGLVSIERTNAFINIKGETDGEGALVFRLTSDGETAWTSPELPIELSEEF